MAPVVKLGDKSQAQAEQEVHAVEDRGGLFVQAVEATRLPMVVTDPAVADNPIVYANQAFLQMFGYSREEVLGRNYHFLSSPSTDPEVARRIDRAMSARYDIVEEVLFCSKDGRAIWVSQLVSPTVEDGRIVRHFASFMDITGRVTAERRLQELNATLERRVRDRTQRLELEIARRQRLEAVLRDQLAQEQELVQQKEFLLQEVNHRTKNALALAASLLQIQVTRSSEAATKEALQTAVGRLSLISEVHALLHQSGAAETVDFAAYLRRLAQDLVGSLQAEPGQVELTVDADAASWGSNLAIPLGLIVTEALVNTFKHGLPEGRQGRIRIGLQRAGGGMMRLMVEDDGTGLPAERQRDGLGLKLIEMFAQKIKGKASLTAGPQGGTTVQVWFPDPSRTALA
jgi:PAS domain S-box-containing protein